MSIVQAHAQAEKTGDGGGEQGEPSDSGRREEQGPITETSGV